MADIELSVIEVKNLGGTHGGKCDPYCQVEIGKDKHTTKTLAKTKNPVWNLSLKLHNIAESEMRFYVFDKSIFSIELVGFVHLDLKSLPNGVEVDQWYELKKERSIANYGDLHLKVKYTKLTIVPRAHSFKSTNFTHPVWCHACEKFIWGLTRQGMKCAAHYRCAQRRDLSSCGTPLKEEPQEQLRIINLSATEFPVSLSKKDSPKNSGALDVVASEKKLTRRFSPDRRQKEIEAYNLATKYLELASNAAREALDEDMSHHFREAKELYETSIGYMMLVVKANVGFDAQTHKLIGERINDYLERVEELVDVLEEEEQEKQLDELVRKQFGEQQKDEENRRKAEEEAKKLEEQRRQKEEAERAARKKQEEERQKELARKQEEERQKKLAMEKASANKPKPPTRSVPTPTDKRAPPVLSIPEVKSSVLNLKSIRGATTKEENLEKTRRKFLMRAPSVVASTRLLIDEDEYRYPQLKAIIDKCKETGEKFVDEDFPANAQSLYKDHTVVPEATKQKIVWKRLTDVIPKAELFVDGVEPGDVLQGALGDCWFLGPLSVVADKSDLFNKIFITTAVNDYGVYAFQFYKAGRWVPVIIDDYLPVDAKTNALVYAHCKDINEVWVPLIEKAYAKLHSCYEAIESGTETNAFLDLTACPPEERNLGENINKEEVFSWILKNVQAGHLVGCSWVTPQKTASNGILPNHAYVVLTVQQVDGNNLIKLRNPWGEGEWTGRWSDNSDLWTDALKQKLKLVEANDGCFWMCDADFMEYFNTYYKCNIIGAEKKRTPAYGEWTKETAGGCTDNTTWRNNPQYLVTLKKAEKISIMITQPERRSRTKNQYPHIGYYLVKTAETTHKETIVSAENLVEATRFQDSRDLSEEHDLEAGTYAIIPCTFSPGVVMPFIITAFSTDSLDLKPAKPWLTTTIEGEWNVANNTAGGCANTPAWKQNNQYLLTVSHSEEVKLILGRTKDDNDIYIGFYVVLAEKESKITSLRAKIAMTTYGNTDVTLSLPLEPGNYIIVPTTFDSGEEGKFCLSALTSSHPTKLTLL